MSLPHALLGMLAVEPASGYTLTKRFAKSMGRWAWHAGHTGIYPELNRLAERGLVEVTAEGARGSRTYALTPAGREELQTWLLNPPMQPKMRNEQVLRMFLLSALDPDDAHAMLERTAEASAAQAQELRAIRDEHGDAPLAGPEGFGQIAAEFGLRYHEAVQAWARWAQHELSRTTADRA